MPKFNEIKELVVKLAPDSLRQMLVDARNFRELELVVQAYRKAPGLATCPIYPPPKDLRSVSLLHQGDHVIQVIKLIREITSMGLKESKDLYDLVRVRPQIVVKDIPPENAAEIVKRFAAVGAIASSVF